GLDPAQLLAVALDPNLHVDADVMHVGPDREQVDRREHGRDHIGDGLDVVSDACGDLEYRHTVGIVGSRVDTVRVEDRPQYAHVGLDRRLLLGPAQRDGALIDLVPGAGRVIVV